MYAHASILCSVRRLSLQEDRRASCHAVTELVWETPLQIIHYPDPRLRARNARVGVFDERLAQLSRELFEVMYNGCAATARLFLTNFLASTRFQGKVRHMSSKHVCCWNNSSVSELCSSAGR